MFRFLLRRLLTGLLVLFIFQTVVYFAIQIILPGDFVSHFALALSPQQMQELRHQLGLDVPLWQGYLNWLGNLLRGNLGSSYSISGYGLPIGEVIQDAVPPTILVFGIGTLLAFLLGQWLGRIIAWRRPDLLTGAITFSGIALYTSFPPWLAFLMIYLLVDRLDLLPPGFDRTLWRNSGANINEVMLTMTLTLFAVLVLAFILNAGLRLWFKRPVAVYGFLFLVPAGWYASWELAGITPLALDILGVAVLPLAAYTLLSFGEIMLIMRSSMNDVMHEQYVHTARAKGLSSRQVRDRHVARNAVLPVLSGMVIRLPYLLTGMVMIEESLNWEGIGTTIFAAVGRQDVILVMGLLLVIGAISLVAHLILDVLHALLDPRIHTELISEEIIR